MQDKPKVTIIDNKIEEVEAIKPNKTVTIRDKQNRTIILKKPNAVQQFRLLELVGPEASKNQVYMNMALPILFIDSIDGVPVMMSTKGEFEALISRLDDEGILSVTNGVMENFKESEDKETIKK